MGANTQRRREDAALQRAKAAWFGSDAAYAHLARNDAAYASCKRSRIEECEL